MTVKFTIEGIPPKTTAQMKRVSFNRGKPRFFKTEAQEDSEAFFQGFLLPHRPQRPLEGAVYLVVDLTWPYRKDEPKRNRNAPLRHTVKPDLDNWVKMFIDCLVQMRFLKDDAQIYSLRVSKHWGDSPGIRVFMGEADSEEEKNQMDVCYDGIRVEA